jgi:triacylglycerol esterase/lipase EstA (alpha/beta hydrolase family)
MGGLVCRYYLESSAFSQEPGFASVESLITIGTPHRGAALALTAAVGLEKRLSLKRTAIFAEPSWVAILREAQAAG